MFSDEDAAKPGLLFLREAIAAGKGLANPDAGLSATDAVEELKKPEVGRIGWPVDEVEFELSMISDAGDASTSASAFSCRGCRLYTEAWRECKLCIELELRPLI